MDPLTGALILGGLGFLGGALGGQQQANMTNAQLKEQAREFARRMKLEEGQSAQDTFRRMQMMPLRDRVSYQINARLGLPTEQFAPRDMFNNAPGPQAPFGTANRQAMNQATANYTSGAGGQIDPSFYQTILRNLGYSQGPGGWSYEAPSGGTPNAGPAGLTKPIGAPGSMNQPGTAGYPNPISGGPALGPGGSVPNFNGASLTPEQLAYLQKIYGGGR